MKRQKQQRGKSGDIYFPCSAGHSRHQRRIKNPGALAPGFTGAWGQQPPTSCAGYIPGPLLATTAAYGIISATRRLEYSRIFGIISKKIRYTAIFWPVQVKSPAARKKRFIWRISKLLLVVGILSFFFALSFSSFPFTCKNPSLRKAENGFLGRLIFMNAAVLQCSLYRQTLP